MEPDQARTLFAASRVAHLATVDDVARPHLVPICFAVEGDRILSAIDGKPKRTTDLRRLRNIVANPSVCLMTHHYDDDWSELWWARADGMARVLPNPAVGTIAALAARYPQYRREPPSGPLIEVTVTRWSGWSAGGT
jgi:PPOX class probable F420-dependent enzyme